jgi:hypothetical protein
MKIRALQIIVLILFISCSDSLKEENFIDNSNEIENYSENDYSEIPHFIKHSKEETDNLIEKYNLKKYETYPLKDREIAFQKKLEEEYAEIVKYKPVVGSKRLKGNLSENIKEIVYHDKRMMDKHIKILKPTTGSVNVNGYFNLQAITTAKYVSLQIIDGRDILKFYCFIRPGYIDINIPLLKVKQANKKLRVHMSIFPDEKKYTISSMATSIFDLEFEIICKGHEKHQFLLPTYTVDYNNPIVFIKAHEILKDKRNISPIKSEINTDRLKALAIYNWITRNFYYDWSLTTRNRASKILTYPHKKETCHGFSVLFCSLCRAVGIKTRRAISNPADNHAWNSVYFDDKWHWVDCTITREKFDFQINQYYGYTFQQWVDE